MTSSFNNAWMSREAARDQAAGVPYLVTNPANDERFRADATAALYPNITPARLAAVLTPKYPRIAVHIRELVWEPFAVWYLYRDGRWLRRDARGSVDDGSRTRRGRPQGNL